MRARPKLQLEACPECDALLRPAALVDGDKAHCPRCGFLLQRAQKNSIERSLALSVAGLLLFVPANCLPLVGIKFLGNAKDGILLSGVAALYGEGMWAVATLVFLSSMLFPLVNILLSLAISLHLYLNRPNRYLRHWMRWLQHLDEWAMLEVYTLGIIVACVKLSSMADLHFGLGLYAFVGLLLVTVALAASLDRTLFWQRIDALRRKPA
ncbi:paraquat-inducible protein A [Methylomicrobium sp. RS1]|jgi:paraquat-inducible protein A|uniref:paraquat-inducible protein A n=1 Tax=Candidatus Methylomicrobium oryzae TaxID=2802053 RepID=UPI0019245C63|nr:paraquat-inducible protein A [Methylomicrobium sp. RS1]MBL1265546.1 paraquat-inducible protein A [Methylomicrobium sp. RS1]